MCNKQKQLWAILLLIAIIVSITACGGGTSEDSKEANSPSASNQQLPQPSDETGPSAEIEPPTEAEQEPEIIRETIEDKAKTAMETLEVWDGSIAESFDGGDGSAGNPYQIANGAQLAKLASDTNLGVDFSGKYFVLTSDILLNDISQWDFELKTSQSLTESWNPWTPIGRPSGNSNIPFEGVFDGSNHIIWGLYNEGTYVNYWAPDSPSGAVGLFGLCEGTISNITVACGLLGPTAESVGVIAGSLGGTINNCHTQQMIIRTSASKIGGICGNGGEIYNSSAEGIIDVVNYGNVIRLNVGGISGSSNVNSGCYNSCEITVYFDVKLDYSNGFDLPGLQVGGICANGNTILECHNAGNITVEAYNQLSDDSTDKPYVRIGGIVGSCVDSIMNCSSSAEITYSGDIVDTYIGGIAGLLGNARPYGSFGELEDVGVAFCYSDTKMITEAPSENVGGIAGSVCGKIEVTNCYYNKEYSSKAVAVTLVRMQKFGSNSAISSSVFTDQIKGLTEDELREASNYYGFDFDYTWSIDASRNDGLPVPISLIEYFEN